MFYDIQVFCCVQQRPPTHWRGCCADKQSLRLCNLMCRLAMVRGWRRVRINQSACLNLCEHGPTMVIYPEGVWYRYDTERDIEEILSQQVGLGRAVPRLLLDPDKIVLRH